MTDKTLKRAARREKLSKRIWEIDFLRGICIILMIWDHFWFLLYNTFGDAWEFSGVESARAMVEFASKYLSSDLRTAAHPLIVILFFLLCGISCSFSKSNLKRGLLMTGCALLITFVTYFMEIPIWFGALHLLAASVLLWCVINLLCRNKRDITAMVCFIAGTFIIFSGYLLLKLNPPADNNFAFVADAFVDNSYYSADYWPLIPNAGFMLVGAALGFGLYRNKKSLLPMLSSPRWYAPVNFAGRIGLWVYVLHQAVFGLIFGLASVLYVTPGNWVII